MPIRFAKRPIEGGVLNPRTPRLNTLLHLCLYWYNVPAIRGIAADAIKYGQAFGADRLWCVLQGPTQIRLALPVARGLGIPMITEVFDPPSWWLRSLSADGLSRRRVTSDFSKAIRRSRVCATASWPMAQKYREQYGVKTVAFLPSLDPSIAAPVGTGIHPGHDLVIGLAGQMYATEEWQALLAALDFVEWKIAGRDVRIRLLGRWIGFNVNGPVRIEYLGWQTQEKAVRLMSEADILYLPYWLDPQFETEARLSFPSKLTTYLAAGRPVLFHGPTYASPAIFLKENDAGFFCHSSEPSQIIDALTRLTTDVSLYCRLAQNGRLAFDKYLTLSSLHRSFAEFLQVEEDLLAPTA